MASSSPSPFFDKEQAATYDQSSARLAPLRDTLLLLAAEVLSELPENARILCIGAGTGAELVTLARRFSRWHFTAVEPSGPDGGRLLEVWARLQLGSPAPSPADLERIRTAYQRDVAVRPPEEIEELLAAGGFPDPILFFQGLLLHGWFARRP